MLSREIRDALKSEFLSRVDKHIASLNYEKTMSGLHVLDDERGCKFIKIKHVSSPSSWPTFRVIFGYNNKLLTSIFDELQGNGATFRKKPLMASWIGHVIQRNFSFAERKKMKGIYSCYPLGEWDIRSEKDLWKSDKVMMVIRKLEPLFFAQEFTAEFYANYPEKINDENDKNFIILQIIAADILNLKSRKKQLMNHYKKRKNFDDRWLNHF